MRKAIIRKSDDFVINVIEIEDGANWKSPDDCYLLDADNSSPGDTWDGKKFIKPIILEPESPRDLEAEIDELKADIKLIKDKLAK